MTLPTTTEHEIKTWLAEGMTPKQIAQRLNRSYSSIAATISVLGLGPKTGKPKGDHGND
jgi:DNA-binding NarL/FixJ family response regulator